MTYRGTLPDGRNKECVQFGGYLIFRDGTIYKKKKNIPMQPVNGMVTLYLGKRPYRFRVKKLIKDIFDPTRRSVPDGEFGDFYGYTVTRDGLIFKNGKQKTGKRLFYADGDQIRSMERSRIVYYVFSGKDLPKNARIEFLDGNPENCAFRNLYVVMKPARKPSLSKRQMDQIIERRAVTGETYKDLGRLFGVSATTIRDVLQNRYKGEQCHD